MIVPLAFISLSLVRNNDVLNEFKAEQAPDVDLNHGPAEEPHVDDAQVSDED